MNRPVFFAANWKMHLHPGEARTYLDRFLKVDRPRAQRTLAFFPPAVSIEAVARAVHGKEHILTGAQDVDPAPKGAFTGATSVHLARGAGASAALVGHSERRHVYGETDAQTQAKVRAVLDGGLMAVLCVGEKLEEREAGNTMNVVERQLTAALRGIESHADVVIAYEPVWAIGTGRNATPADAAEVHSGIRGVLAGLGLSPATRVLYGGSVKGDNVAELLAAAGVDGVLVGGASLDPDQWAAICAAG